jgi:hypothetical protein
MRERKNGAWKYTGTNPYTGKKYFCWKSENTEKKPRGPEPPPNFTSEELASTFPIDHPPIITNAQAYELAIEKKECND